MAEDAIAVRGTVSEHKVRVSANERAAKLYDAVATAVSPVGSVVGAMAVRGTVSENEVRVSASERSPMGSTAGIIPVVASEIVSISVVVRRSAFVSALLQLVVEDDRRTAQDSAKSLKKTIASTRERRNAKDGHRSNA